MSVDKDLISVQQARDLVEAAHARRPKWRNLIRQRSIESAKRWPGLLLTKRRASARWRSRKPVSGFPHDKQEKNRFAAEDVWNYFRGLRTKGVVSESKDVVEIASPRGVVAGIIPSTNPTSTAIFKILIAIKSRNTVVLVAASVRREVYQ